MSDFKLTQNIVDEIKAYRHQVRSLGTLGGCYQVSLFIENFHHLPMREGIYQSENLEPIVSHRWNILPDGSILESTGDQFCEGTDVTIIEPSHELFQRYRPQWSVSLNPTVTPWLKHFKWLGLTDADWKKQNPDKMISEGYWLTNNSEYLKWRKLMTETYEVYAKTVY